MKLLKKIGAIFSIVSLLMIGSPAVSVASGIAENLLAGAAAIVYVKTQIRHMDDNGQKEVLQNTIEKVGYLSDEAYQQRAKRILAELSKSKLVSRKYEVFVNPGEDINAFMTLAAVMSINKGTMDALDDHQLAYVMAHEIGHGEHRDIVKGMEKSVGLSVALSLYAGEGSLFSDVIANYVEKQVFTMKQEKRADKTGFDILADTKFNIGGSAAAMQALHKKYGDHYREGLGQVVNPNDHPKTSDRVLENIKRMKEYSFGHVEVKGKTVYLDKQLIYEVPERGRYSGEERAHYVAGKLARAYHEKRMKMVSVRGNTVYLDEEGLVTTPSSEIAQAIAEKINNIISTSLTDKNKDSHKTKKK